MNVRAEAVRVPGARPVPPTALLSFMEMQPATEVPCLSQALKGWPVPPSVVVSVPGSRWFRSGCVASTPTSMTSVMMEFDPVVMSQALTAFMSWPATPPANWAVLRRAHWFTNCGSEGTRSPCPVKIMSGSAKRTSGSSAIALAAARTSKPSRLVARTR